MRKELYRLLCSELKAIDLIKHIDLWNHNVEFIEQEENWERPAVFVEFCPIQWNAIVPGVEYRAKPFWSWIWWRGIPITTMRILWKVLRCISVWPSSGCNSRHY